MEFIELPQMNIVSVTRQSSDPMTGEGRTDFVVVIDDQTMYVPQDESNGHYQEIMRQVEAGELVIEEADSGSE